MTSGFVKIWVWWVGVQILAGSKPRFRDAASFCFKTRPSANPFLWKLFFIIMQIKLIFTRKVLHLARFKSEGFWNSEMAYSFLLSRDVTTSFPRFLGFLGTRQPAWWSTSFPGPLSFSSLVVLSPLLDDKGGKGERAWERGCLMMSKFCGVWRHGWPWRNKFLKLKKLFCRGTQKHLWFTTGKKYFPWLKGSRTSAFQGFCLQCL